MQLPTINFMNHISTKSSQRQKEFIDKLQVGTLPRYALSVLTYRLVCMQKSDLRTILQQSINERIDKLNLQGYNDVRILNGQSPISQQQWKKSYSPSSTVSNSKKLLVNISQSVHLQPNLQKEQPKSSNFLSKLMQYMSQPTILLRKFLNPVEIRKDSKEKLQSSNEQDKQLITVDNQTLKKEN